MIIQTVTVTRYRGRAGTLRATRALAYRDAAWQRIATHCRAGGDCPYRGQDGNPCRYHDQEFRAADWPQHTHEDPPWHGFRPPAIWGLPRADEEGYWTYGRAVAYRLARFYRYLDERPASAGDEGKGRAMQTFDATRGCPKCGCLDVHAQWMGAADYRSPWEGAEESEHIQRHCRRCHYQWNESPIRREIT